ncbi:MAG: hypothetical protein CM15mP51_09360 [Porticoccaceae bacterium]|nr:MAG: hypothetical protein CM15mP51_09360 [Porticoccaceae bacterium]
MKDQGIPIISIFLSGRPLWVNAEINASDAFIAAWLPGSEGIGIADVSLPTMKRLLIMISLENFPFLGPTRLHSSI